MAKKLVLGVLLLVVLVGVGAVLFVGSNLDRLVKAAMEKYGSEVTMTDVRVDRVNISMSSGEGTVSGFSVANPKSFIAAKAIDIGSVDLKVDTASIVDTKGRPIIIENITIDSPSIVYEINAKGRDNMKVLQQNMTASSRMPKQTGGENAGQPSRKVMIRNLYINNGKVEVSYAPLAGQKVEAELPPIHLTNIGGGGGAMPEQIAKIVIAEISKRAAQAGQSEIRKAYVDKKLEGATGKAEDAVKNAIGKAF